jgi:hypothetical protein
MPRATNAADTRLENCVRSNSAGSFACRFITHHRQNFYGCRYRPTNILFTSSLYLDAKNVLPIMLNYIRL